MSRSDVAGSFSSGSGESRESISLSKLLCSLSSKQCERFGIDLFHGPDSNHKRNLKYKLGSVYAQELLEKLFHDAARISKKAFNNF